MKKIALVTCYFQPNYGSQLQAYATQMAFDQLGLENETILIDGLVPEINKAKYKYFLSRIFDKNTIKDKWATVRKVVAKKRNKDYAKNLCVRNLMFTKFAKDMFKTSRTYGSKAELAASAESYSAFVVGSDQLWLPSNIAADYYTLNFVPETIPKIALATSFGVSSLPKKQTILAAKFLNRIDYVSIREQSGQKLIKDIAGRDVPVVCDPTLMFTAEDWAKITPQNRFVEEKYIFVYFLGNNPEQRQFVEKVREVSGYKIIQLAHCDEFVKSDVGFADETPYNVGPREFIQLVRDAEYVFTDSFHCSVFSMLHQKKFFTFRRYSSDGNVSTNGRLYSLLSLVSLENRLLNGSESVDDVMKSIIDYSSVQEKLSNMRMFTWNWLKQCLKEKNLI